MPLRSNADTAVSRRVLHDPCMRTNTEVWHLGPRQPQPTSANNEPRKCDVSHGFSGLFLSHRKISLHSEASAAMHSELCVKRSVRPLVLICTPFTGHPVEGVLLCGTHMSTKGNV